MPANEQTWRNLTLLHKIFAISGVILLVSTIWMFVADHNREWKPFQRNANRVEIQLAEWRKTQYESEAASRALQALDDQLAAEKSAPIPAGLIDQFKAAVTADAEQRRNDEKTIHREAMSESQVEGILGRIDRYRLSGDEGGYERGVLSAQLEPLLTRARFRENDLLTRRKFKSATLDAAKATLGLAVRDNKPAAEQDELQAGVDQLTAEVATLTLQYQAAAAHRQTLQNLIAEMTAQADQLAKERADAERDLQRLADTVEARRSNYFEFWGMLPLPGKKWLEMPILDAFNSPRKIENLWSDGLTQDYNFSRVRRFDRCTTCHQAIDKTLPGSATEPAYVHERLVELVLQVPAERPAEGETAAGSVADRLNQQLDQVYGLQFAAEGLLDLEDVTIDYVRPESLAARATLAADDLPPQTGDQIRLNLLKSARTALGTEGVPAHDVPTPGLMVGDVIVAIDGDPVHERSRAGLRLLDATAGGPGKTVRLTVRRGLPNPYASHPRLDLFVGSLSPHKLADFACTVCHDGQGSATSFKWASHAPNDLTQRGDWMKEYGWFDNPHWIYPMYPRRLAEAACLKCHHEVTELEPSPRFPDPPAPTVTHGYHLMRKYGCYGCHEINGYDGPDQRVGPDMRLEPNYFAAAQAIRGEPDSGFDKLSAEQKDWIDQLIQHPDRNRVRHDLYNFIVQDERAEQPLLSTDVHQRIAPLLRDVETPGDMRRSGPALRFLSHKLDDSFLADWLRDPRHFRPSTRMPKFFGMWEHLDEPSLEISQRFEPIEVLGMAAYLQANSQQFDYLEQPATDSPQLTTETATKLSAGELDETLQAMVARGRQAFQERGCLACHEHAEFADAERFRDAGTIVQGPDLSAIGTKFAPQRNPRGVPWLYSWIKQPTRYHARTVMPDLYLDPVTSTLADGTTQQTDPVADIVAWLLVTSKSDWQPAAPAQLSPELRPALDELTLEYLKDAFYVTKAQEVLQSGIPPAEGALLKGAERELILAGGTLGQQQKLEYVGSKTIARYGCYACHDIPGFEDAKPIGTGLADWGRKEPAKLAFEHIVQYLHGGHGHGGHGGPSAAGHEEHAEDAPAGEAAGHAAHGNDYGELPDFYEHQIEGGHREGFIYQKLREPRSYDYHKTRNKKYSERLRMPHFNFDHEQREAVVTFVLGLVADPPGEKYVYSPDNRQSALIAGRQVLDKYNCGSCHLLEAEKWNLAFDPGWELFTGESTNKSQLFPFLRLEMPPEVLAQSEQPDRRGLHQAELAILPILAPRDGIPVVKEWNDEELVPEGDLSPGGQYDPRNVVFETSLLRPTAISGNAYSTLASLRVPSTIIESSHPSDGGFLAKYLLPHLTARVGNDLGTQAWSWVPPMLVGQGNKVQTDWLHSFLLNPHPIRPAVVLRMPRFNMSPAEATALVHYFAARDQADYPYQFDIRRQPERLRAADLAYAQQLDPDHPRPGQRLRDAMNIIVDKKQYCAQCHQIGDFHPEGKPVGHGPDLANVNRRLRAEYVRNWIAYPKTILPYTAMPVNIAYDESLPNLGTKVPQDYYHGNSLEQLSAVVDLLMNWDVYLEQQKSFAEMVQQATPPAAPAAPATEATGAEATSDAAAGDAAAGDAAAGDAAAGGNESSVGEATRADRGNE
ncbi:MAG: hypothetical protein J5I93_19540 [Pirellulaceae bacterium]|nr:hypothetical protein [Pirellulaceae bacterium]